MDLETPIGRLIPVLAALLLAVLLESVVPLRNQSARLHGRLPVNLALLGMTFGLSVATNFAVVFGAAYVARLGVGLLQVAGAGKIVSFIVTIVALDGVTYLAHRLMHGTAALWRLHLVHHCDAAVDATTAFRQHPIEGLVRFSFIAAAAWLLGAPPAAIAIYRLLSALNAVLEHANIRVPRWLDRVLVLVWVTPHMHKIHHSRERHETDSNYANLFSIFDRAFHSYTPSSRGTSVRYGIDGHDAPEHQSLWALLRLPFVRQPPPASDSVSTEIRPRTGPGVASWTRDIDAG